MSLNVCSTVAIIQMMATAGDVQEELEDSDERVNMADIESGGRDRPAVAHHRKSRGKTIAF
jgi:hypothetical protein